MLVEAAAKSSVKSRGKTNPRGVKRKMSNFTCDVADNRCTKRHLPLSR
jgi:hypothetical protein